MSQKNIRRSQMEQEWYSWEYLIREDVRRLNYRFLMAQQAMKKFSRSAKAVEKFALDRMRQIILEECSKYEDVKVAANE